MLSLRGRCLDVMTCMLVCSCWILITGWLGSYVPGTASSMSRHDSNLGETYCSSSDVNYPRTNHSQCHGYQHITAVIVTTSTEGTGYVHRGIERPKNTWNRVPEKEMWRVVPGTAGERWSWPNKTEVACGLCYTGSDKIKWHLRLKRCPEFAEPEICRTVNNWWTLLTLSLPIPLRLYTLPYWSNPPFLIFDIWALWRSVLSARAPKCQKIRMVG